MADPDRCFPVLLYSYEWPKHPTCPRTVPWAMIAPHEEQARRNHGGQSLARLAERRGLSPRELVAVLRDVPFKQAPATEEAAVEELLVLLATYTAANQS